MAKLVEAKAVNIITAKKEIEARTAALKLSAAGIQAEAHVLACSVLVHVAKHGNINVLAQFIDALPDMVRKNAVHQWFETFGQLTFGPNDEGVVGWRIDRTKKVRLGEAMIKPFWKFKANEGAPYKPLVMDTYLDEQIKKLERDMKLAPFAGEGVDPRKMLVHSLKACKTASTTTQTMQ